MARAMLVAAALAALAAAARYADYAGGNMPSYGAVSDYEGPRDSPAADEYHDSHPQDVSMGLDYKFAEDSVGSYKSKSKDATDRELEEMDIWQKPEKNEKKLRSQDTGIDHDNFDKYHATENIGYIQRMPKVSLRHKTRSVGDGENRMQNQGHKYNMRSITDIEGFGHFQSQEETHEDKTIGFKSRNRLRNKENIFRAKVRRKPRDKTDKDIFADPPPLDESELSFLKKMAKESKHDLDYPMSGPELDLSKFPSAPAQDDNKEMKINKPPKSHGDYDEEYYDMKRVNSIKEKLPGLMDRSITGSGAEKRKDMHFAPTELVRDDVLWANRRMVPDPETPALKEPTSSSTTSSTTVNTTVTTTTRFPTPDNKTSTLSNDELSLAEKSRLSILKKAQRKESFGNASSTSKPPVLLQVVNKAQTLVMVEPPTSPDPLFRAREVPEDSPERLSLVKRMMRHKLVAGARSIRELTDNWDEMVCDYVDMSLLENNASSTKCNSAVFLCVTIILMCFIINL